MARRKKSFMIVTGVKELDANLQTLAGPAATRISKSALRAGMRVLAKAQKAAAPRGPTGATAASIGSRLSGKPGESGRQAFKAKAGVNVGKRSKAGAILGSARLSAHGSSGRRLSAGARRARGAARAAPHAHLVALGSGPRYTGGSGIGARLRRGVRGLGSILSRRARRSGGRGYRGKMPANPFIALTFSREENAVKFAIREALAAGIAREVNKLGKKTGAPVGVS
jgi:HK97 gp10 family phage protein